ncbi:hypothetical protein BKA00_003799 [Actinomadura coerulea]|uniref:Ig-like domain-containing protein n=1 Tax=Actinomadura coerulea TaxID=46159 RepID=A0A7X0KZX4_9ACTN|nr:hypothetical protein [Actinomadura coerulea]MBB6396885.1 hypothetical protein [Actinomadura coerulea]GGP95091.1 hypothetical protein GCM10010187_08230 [Actinomadura coerulea]
MSGRKLPGLIAALASAALGLTCLPATANATTDPAAGAAVTQPQAVRLQDADLTLEVGGPPKTFSWPADQKNYSPMQVSVTAPPYTRITALDLHCTQGHQCPTTIADDGRSATGNFTVNWSFTDDIEVTLQATDDAPQQGGTFEGSISLGDQTRPITVTILPRTQPAVTACRKALDQLQVREGMCFWPQQDFQGQIFVRPRPSGTDTCGNINPAKSAVNLTRETRLLYAFARCDLSNFITQVEPNEARSQFGPDTTAQSWR